MQCAHIVLLIYTEQTVRARNLFALKRDWIRGLIFSYAGPDLGLFPGGFGPRLLNVSRRVNVTYKTMQKKLSNYIYKASIGMMVFSTMLLLFVQQMVPFSVTASWSEGGLGSSLVLTRPNVHATQGQEVAGSAAVLHQVNLFTVREVMRREGATYYRVSNSAVPDENELVTIPAQQLGHSVLVSIPLLGVLVQMLAHPIGLMILIGLPMLMVGINYGLRTVQGILPTIISLEKKTQQKARRMVQSRDSDSIEGAVTVLKPYGTHQRFSI